MHIFIAALGSVRQITDSAAAVVFSESYEPFGDALGSVRQLTDSSAAVVFSQSYEPFGGSQTSNGTSSSNYGFAGEWTDATGLQHLRARYYNTGTGRFTSRDTWGGDNERPLSLNKWAYVEGNPVNYTDPTGRCLIGEPDNSGICSGETGPYDSPTADYHNANQLSALITKSRGGKNSGNGDATTRGNVETPPPGISWNPSIAVNNREPQLGTTQYWGSPNGDGIFTGGAGYNSPFGANICGQASLSVIVASTVGGSNWLSKIWDYTDNTEEPVVNTVLAEALLQLAYYSGDKNWHHYIYNFASRYSLEITSVTGNPGSEEFTYGNVPGSFGTNPYSYERYEQSYPDGIKRMIASGHYYMAFLNITASGILKPTAGIPHYVTIAGFSAQWDHNVLDSKWNWVKIYNSFNNRHEYYWWNEFRISVTPGYALEIWHD